MILYARGGGKRPTHNFQEECVAISRLSRFVVLVYIDIGGGEILSPFTVAATEGPTFLFLRQEQLVASLDSLCPNPIVERFMANAVNKLGMERAKEQFVKTIQDLKALGERLTGPAAKLLKESRKRSKPSEGDDVVEEETEDKEGRGAAKKAKRD